MGWSSMRDGSTSSALTGDDGRPQMSPGAWKMPAALELTLDSWDLDLYSCHGLAGGASETELLGVALALFNSVGISSTLNVPTQTVQNFLYTTCQGYQPQPFHNFAHGVYVLQGCVVALKRSATLRELLRPKDQLALCIAAIGHDVGHMGVQNTFLERTNDPLAMLYNDRSVLESMHASRLFYILQRAQGCGLFERLTVDEFRELRKLMIDAIMATDLKHHFDDLTKFNNRIENAEKEPWTIESAADRQMAVNMVLHAADLSGPARPWAVSSVWADRVQQEFVAQVAQEEKLQLPVSSFLLAPKPKLEQGFMKLFALPLWQAVAKFLPELEDRVADLNANYQQWEQMLEEMDQSQSASP